MTPKAEVKQEKKDYVSSLGDKLKEAKSVVFVDYSGMGVKLQQDFKSKLRDVGGSMVVAKNTLIKLASKSAGLPEEASIQILGKFAKDNEIPKIKAGMVEGVYIDQAGVVRIASLPSKEQLYANVVGAISAPMYGLVRTLQGNLQKLVYILKQKSQLDS